MFLRTNQHSESILTEGIVTDIVTEGKEWIVRVHGIYWHARSQSSSSFAPGDIVQVTGRKDVKLFITPMVKNHP